MKIRAYVSGYPPVQGAGAEWYLHTMMRDFRNRGHDVQVVITGKAQKDYPDEYQGVCIDPEKVALRGWPDIIIGQLGGLPTARTQARSTRTPLVHINNNDWSWRHAPTAALQVYNSEWVAKRAGTKGIVVHPPVWAEDYAVTPGYAVTLINLMAEKGAAIFWRLAERNPDVPFLAVRGGWGAQVIPPRLPMNVVLLENTPDMKEVYRRTRILLVPSDYESFGRVAVEAAVSGIPVLASLTPGLRESMGPLGAHWVEGGVDAWQGALQAHLEGSYAFQGQRGQDRVAELNDLSIEQLDDLEYRLKRLAR